MPESLRGLVTENDFETFCDKIDNLLVRYYGKIEYLLTLCVVSTLAIMGFYVLTPNTDGCVFPIRIILFLITTLMITMFIGMCVVGCKQVILCKQIHAECLELTNRTANVTFRLVTKYVKQSDNSDEGLRFKFSHIDVTINIANDNIIVYSEPCYGKQ